MVTQVQNYKGRLGFKISEDLFPTLSENDEDGSFARYYDLELFKRVALTVKKSWDYLGLGTLDTTGSLAAHSKTENSSNLIALFLVLILTRSSKTESRILARGDQETVRWSWLTNVHTSES